MPEYIDIHSHLDFSDFDADREAVISEMATRRIATITIGTELKTSRAAVALAAAHPHIFASIGAHPAHEGEGFSADAFEPLVTPKVVAVGECGFDFFRLSIDVEDARRTQSAVFEAQIDFADTHRLPLMLHCRSSKGTMDAYEAALDLLESRVASGAVARRGDFHFFAGNIETARRALNLGFTISFDGPITFAREYDEVIRFAPLSMIMAETDAPFAAPVPMRGKRNSPLLVPHIVEAIAAIRNEPLEEVKQTLVENAIRVFGLPKEPIA